MRPIVFHKMLFLLLILINTIIFVLILKVSDLTGFLNHNKNYPDSLEQELLQYREFLIYAKNKYANDPEIYMACDDVLKNVNDVIFSNSYDLNRIYLVRNDFYRLSQKIKNDYLLNSESNSF